MNKPPLPFLGIAAILFAASIAHAENIVFPDDANILNVKASPYNAKGDGISDDTEAIRSAFQSTGMLYFPNGTYLVSGAIVPPHRKGKVPSRRVLQGQSMAGAVIKLKDNTPAFGNPAAPLGLFKMSHAPEQAFRNGVRNLTIDTGKGNAGAIGMQYYASNQGGMHHVSIRSGDGQGKIGLDLNFSGNNGPLLVKDIRVSGFDIGIDGGSGHLCTFEQVKVENQNQIGFFSQSYAFVRGFSSVQKNAIPAVLTKGHSLVTLLDARCEGTGAAAIVAGGQAMLARNVATIGYDNAIKQGDTMIKGPNVAEWTAQPVQSLFLSPPHSLDLPIKETPEVPWDDPKTWANVLKFAPPRDNTKKSREDFDITEAFQKAIDSGATTVYFPTLEADADKDKYHLRGTVYVRGNVRRILGMEAEFRAVPGSLGPDDEAQFAENFGKEKPAKIVIDKGAAPVVVIERFNSMYGGFSIENRSPRTLVVSSMFAQNIGLLPGAGDLFVEDLCFAFLDINGQNVWMRQANMEASYPGSQANPRPNVRQNGGTLWVHGLKTEQNRTKLIVKNGAAEVSAFILANRSANPLPMFESIDSRLSVSVVEDVLRKAPFAIAVRETRGKETRDWTHEMAQKGGEGKIFSLFAGDKGSGSKAPAAPTNLRARGTNRLEVSWDDGADNEDGFLVEISDGGEFSRAGLAHQNATAFVLPKLKAGTAYTVRVRAFNGAGTSGEATVKTTTAAAIAAGSGTGMRGQYFRDIGFRDLKLTRTDAQINFDWAAEAAVPGLGRDGFSVRWTGTIEPRFSETYTFSTFSDDGVRLWVGAPSGSNVLLLSDWKPGSKRKTGEIALEAGKKVPIRLEFLELEGGAQIQLWWQSANQEREIVPASQLNPATEAEKFVEVGVSASAEKIKENERAVFTITRRGDAGEPLTLRYTLTGSAISGLDYRALPGTITLPAGTKETTIALEIVDDKIGEPDKTLTLELAPEASYYLTGGVATLALQDDDMPPPGVGTGLRAELFSDTKFTTLKTTRTDKTIDFNWDKKAPTPGLDPKGYAIRWTGRIQPLFSETYTLSADVTPYGGVKVWLDGKPLLDTFVKGNPRNATIALEAGRFYDCKVEFVNSKVYGAKVALSWSSPRQFKQIVPQSQLFPAAKE